MYNKMLTCLFALLFPVMLTTTGLQAAKESQKWTIHQREHYSPERIKDIEEKCKILDKIQAKIRHDDEQLEVSFSGFEDGKRTYDNKIVWRGHHIEKKISELDYSDSYAYINGYTKTNVIREGIIYFKVGNIFFKFREDHISLTYTVTDPGNHKLPIAEKTVRLKIARGKKPMLWPLSLLWSSPKLTAGAWGNITDASVEAKNKGYQFIFKY
jgi:hypothetical protein